MKSIIRIIILLKILLVIVIISTIHAFSTVNLHNENLVFSTYVSPRKHPKNEPEKKICCYSSSSRNSNFNDSDSNNMEDDEEYMYLGDFLDIEGVIAAPAEHHEDHNNEPTEEELMALEEELANYLIYSDSSLMFDQHDEDEEEVVEEEEEESEVERYQSQSQLKDRMKEAAARGIERALMAGVVPASAGVGSQCLPGDYGFDPFNLSNKDYFKSTQRFLKRLIQIIPSFGNLSLDDDDSIFSTKDDKQRPTALILRDYREAEVRHGRLAMLAAILWPLQEILDRVLMSSKFGYTTFIYGGTTLPYLTLFMTGMLLLLGYLDIYSVAIKEMDAGEAFLPGECFWDPLCLLEGAPEDMKTNMQKRELNNGRIAMVTVAVYALEEAITHKPLISLPYNEYLFEPAFFIPSVRQFLDQTFSEPMNLPLGDDDIISQIYQISETMDDLIN